jgi:hypothetical protein
MKLAEVAQLECYKELLHTHHNDKWRMLDPLTEDNNAVKFYASPLFDKTFTEKTQQYPNLAAKFAEFQHSKTESPGAPFGGSDTSFIAAGPIARVIPKLKHAHLTRDLSVYYTIEGKDPTMIKLYGIFSHQESGTGTPGNINKQKSLSKQLKNQPFG